MSLDIARKDTICALSSAQGPSAISIVRASGPNSKEIFDGLFRAHRGQIKPAKAMHGVVIDSQGNTIDDVMAILFVGSKSFTGENSFEIHCHGNPLIVDQILQTICCHDARLALPGEFSMRAVLNGKIDLAQAESIADLIHAKSTIAKQIALKGVQGGLREKTENIRDTIVSVLAEIEARMDFPDEDLGHYQRDILRDRLLQASSSLSNLLKNSALALRLHEGARVVICGLPNAGKSTLLNRFLGHNRAIVHETAGTTRDVIEANWLLQGLPITLVDIAGIREDNELCAIEKIGIERAVQEISQAELIIWLADATKDHPFTDAVIKKHLEQVSCPIIHVLNKIEMSDRNRLAQDVLKISAQTGYGLDNLLEKIKTILISDSSQAADLFITRARQRDELLVAMQSIKHAEEALRLNMVDEIVTSELRGAGLAFDRLFGTELSEDILDKIFSEFCIGK
jgi:tRNA modification GTPase